ncbi:Asparaginase/glutaminase [Roseibium aggregatum IAM 12614]|uniref:Asparaginase/glutaminase n=1 Tax=Roseibium aggregatum (strain ATCC 25650 / DSM 13394 / JCM 20685 / NBRC 16684 / NCIMB 2208 / IAM 12614 / B1) TaxID=384765 RepID=A0NZ85_ROSAI|nr:asparaginase [Roseibium aggregatum]EAV41764.1 Asparaginase/glutaminase [Roseibium aggregatum IAM 12614]
MMEHREIETEGGEKPAVGLIVAGGTLNAIAEDPFEVCDYGQVPALDAKALLRRFGDYRDVVALPCDPLPSFDMGPASWQAICRTCTEAYASRPGMKGFVLTHGTGSLEEAAYYLSLAWELDVPLVITGAQRPASAASSDGPMNLHHAIATARDERLRDANVVVAVDAELHDPVDVTKTSNTRLDTFQSPWAGPIGRFTGARLDFFRRPLSPGIKIGGATGRDLPRVDILYCHSGGDAAAVEAFAAAGAQGIVIAGFAPGYATSTQAQALANWSRERGGVVVSASRGGGRVPHNSRNSAYGFLPAGVLSPVKARILLQSALSQQKTQREIAELFDTLGED